MMAGLFREAIEASAGWFDEVVFAITDSTPERRFIGPFEAVCAGLT
jgi:hypothetical protein